MDELEFVLLRKLYDLVMGDDFPDRMLAVEDLKRWHRKWLGNVYEWAGQERSVNLTKVDFSFAAAAQIPRLLEQFQAECLNRYTPCHGLGADELITAIAVTHVELILIHPFREGNGRLARLLADVMAVQAGYESLEYEIWDARRDRYFEAIQAGVDRNYGPMRELVEGALVE